jgi:DNA-binding SARP family transcriptional activator/tetratricopeptide (TPR) repeat protein
MGAVLSDRLTFAVLGQVVAVRSTVPVDLERPRQRAVLTYLLLNGGRLTTTERLIDAVWGDRSPATARAQVHADIAALRRQLGTELALNSVNGGYRLDLQPDQLDLDIFHQHIESARTLADGDPETAALLLRQALDLWRGAALDGINAAFVDAARVRLDEQRLRTVERLADLELTLGRAADLVAELDSWVRAEPLRESLRSRLMIALHRTGRRADALTMMRAYRQTLADEHGMDPGPELLRTEHMIRQEDPDQPVRQNRHPATETHRMPARFLPRDIADFTGRIGELHHLDTLTAGVSASASAVIAIGGVGGTGKTALAVHWAHRHAQRFPDGQIFVDMQSYGREPELSADHAIVHLLRQLGHSPELIPQDRAHARELYRSSLSGRALLLLIDNAGHIDQVRPLLAPTGCVTLITSRAQLTGLVARDGGHLLTLSEMTQDDANRLVLRVLGERGVREPDAVAELAAACGHLPLALRIAAANIVGHAASTVADQVGRLHRADRVSALTVDGDPDSNLRVVFDHSCDVLGDGTRAVFGIAGRLPGLTFTADTVAAASGRSIRDAGSELGRLVSAHLVTAVDETVGMVRFGMHDLVRAYAAGLPGPGDEMGARISDWYLRVAHASATVLAPHLRAVTPHIVYEPQRMPFGDDQQAVLEFLNAESSNLLPAARYAIGHGHPRAAWQMFYLLIGYFERGHRAALALAMGGCAVEAAVADGDPVGERISRSTLGALLNTAHRPAEAVVQLLPCVGLAQQVGNLKAEANAHHNLGRAYGQLGRDGHAARSYARALTAFRATGDIHNTGMTMNNLGGLHMRTGQFDVARRWLDDAMEVWSGLDRPDGKIHTLLNLGQLCQMRHDYAAAAAHLRQARAAAVATAHRGLEIEAIQSLGELTMAMGDSDEARSLFQTGLTLSIAVGDSYQERILRELLDAALESGGTDASRHDRPTA